MTKKTPEEILRLVVLRLRIMPANWRLWIGDEGEFTRDELVEHVEKDDTIGKKIVDVQIKYLQRMKELLAVNG